MPDVRAWAETAAAEPKRTRQYQSVSFAYLAYENGEFREARRFRARGLARHDPGDRL